MGAMEGQWAVVLADIVSSRDVASFRRLRDDSLGDLSRRHRDSTWVLAPYTVTAWDEFQNILRSPASTADVIFDLRCTFQPLELRVAIGVGEIAEMPRRGEPLNVGATGPAFERARAGMDELKAGGHKYRTLTAFRSDDPAMDRVINLIYRLHDTLIRRITRRQWETIQTQVRTSLQEETAGLLGIDESTVTRNLQRGYYWQIEDVRRTVGSMLEEAARS